MNSFKKEERLCSRKHLDLLFTKGSSFLLYPFRVSYLLADPTAASVQVVINVPKKRFKKAVDRNKIKRRTREVYRCNKSLHLYSGISNAGKSLLLSLQYIGNEIHETAFLEKKLLLVFGKLITALKNESN